MNAIAVDIKINELPAYAHLKYVLHFTSPLSDTYSVCIVFLIFYVSLSDLIYY